MIGLFFFPAFDREAKQPSSKMSKLASPTHFKGELDHFYDPSFTAEISQKMQVPKSIRVAGDDIDDHQRHNQWLNEKFEMHVPDRILVAGMHFSYLHSMVLRFGSV